MSSDEADRRRTYAELERRGQRTPGKYFGLSTPKLRVKKTPEVKTIDMTKIFGQDRNVITPDNQNIEATFLVAKKLDSGASGEIEATLNYKEQ